MVSAMSYLEAKHFMLHRDLASRNFLMASESCVKLADFGRARLVVDDCYQAPRKERICIKWASPEVLINSRYSSKSDVWAVGVVFWELFSWGERPYASLPGEQTAVYVVEGGRLDKPSECPPDLYQLMRNCWKENPQRRPTFTQLHEQLRIKSCAYSEHSFQPKRPNSLAVGSVNQLVTPSSSKPTTPSSAKFRLTYPAAKKSDKFTLQREAPDDRRNSFEPKLLVYRNRGGTSSSETSIASGNGFLDLERGEEDLSRGDRIRRSLRNLMKIKTKGRPGARLDIPGAKRCQDTLWWCHFAIIKYSWVSGVAAIMPTIKYSQDFGSHHDFYTPNLLSDPVIMWLGHSTDFTQLNWVCSGSTRNDSWKDSWKFIQICFWRVVSNRSL